MNKKLKAMMYKLTDTRKEKSMLPANVVEMFEKHAKRVSEFFKRYSKPVNLEIHLSGDEKKGYHLSYSLRLKDGSIVYADGRDRSLEKLVAEVFRSFIRALKRERAQERKEHLVKRAKKAKEKLIKAQRTLVDLHHNDLQEEFKYLIGELLPSVKRYMHRRIRTFEAKGLIPEGKVSLMRAFDRVKEYLFEHFAEYEKGNVPLDLQAYKAADEVLESILKSGEWAENLEVTSIEELAKKEAKSMEEEFSTDGDGDLVMLEELDDISYHLDEYTTDDINLAVDDEERIMEELDEGNSAHSKEDILNKKINTLMHELPWEDSGVYDLYIHGNLSFEEIAVVKDKEPKEIENIVKKVEMHLKSELSTGNANTLAQ